uniref:Translation initiation factor IF- 2 domain-containing protein n=1 Tax=Emiliania huxleyi TaxID=2903 RepID=A0A7S3WMZ4_EMIHU
MGKGLGILSTVLVQRGALRQGDHVVAGQSWGKVRLLLDEEGAQLSEAGPAVPVRVSGMREMPRAGDELLVVGPSVSRLSPPCNGASYIGDEMLVVPSEARAKEVVEFRLLRAEAQALAAAAPRRGRKGGGAKLLPALLKAESFGSLEAAREGLSHFPSTRVELKLVREGVGPVTESDVQLAQSVGAQVIAFNVPLESKAAGLAATLQVPVHSHSIIYALVDAAKEMLEAPAVDPHGGGGDWAEIGRRLSRGWGRD